MRWFWLFTLVVVIILTFFALQTGCASAGPMCPEKPGVCLC